MKPCRILASHSAGPFGQGVAVFRCEEHGIAMEGPVDTHTLCPIGRIEQATEEALKKIAEAAISPTRYP